VLIVTTVVVVSLYINTRRIR